jgi:uncharacterized protein Yka (UPF0111/DUF47 family)
MKLYQVSSISYDGLDDFLNDEITEPTTSYDKAREQFDQMRQSALNTADEDLSDEIDPAEDFMDYVSIDETDGFFKISYNRNGSDVVIQNELRTWDIAMLN